MAHDPALLSSILCFCHEIEMGQVLFIFRFSCKASWFYDCCNSFQLFMVANTIFLSVSGLYMFFLLIKSCFSFDKLAGFKSIADTYF